jgi:hypothetical protein
LGKIAGLGDGEGVEVQVVLRNLVEEAGERPSDEPWIARRVVEKALAATLIHRHYRRRL